MMVGSMYIWIFDHSSCHAARADDALDVGKMNVKPGGKQCIVHDTIWNGKRQCMNFPGVPKGLRQVYIE